MEGEKSSVSKEQLRLLVHLLLPLCIYWAAEQMSVSVLADITTTALCPGNSTCSQAIYLNGLQQMVVGICKMIVIPIIGQLADEYGRKPLLLLIVSTAIFPSAILAINESKEFVYAYYVLRIISHIMSQGSIFCISAAYAADILDGSSRAAAFGWMHGILSLSHVLGNLLARLLPGTYIFEVSVALLIIAPMYMIFFLNETVKMTPHLNQHLPWSNKVYKLVQERYSSMRYALNLVTNSSTLKCICLVSFFYDMGMSGISSVLMVKSSLSDRAIFVSFMKCLVTCKNQVTALPCDTRGAFHVEKIGLGFSGFKML